MSTAIDLLHAQYEQSFQWYQGTMADVTQEAAHYQPAGTLLPIAAQAAHIITGLDFLIVGQVGGKPPLLTGDFADQSGLSEPPPQGDWSEWGRRVQVELSALSAYAQAVFDAVGATIGSLSDEDLAREIDLGGMGKQSLSWVFTIMLLNTFSHTGEIAAIKGLQGLKGYPV